MNLRKITFIVITGLLLGGCTSPEQERSARAYQESANKRLKNADVATQMEQRAAGRFPEIYSTYRKAFSEGRKIGAPKLISTVAPKYPFGKRLVLAQATVWVAFTLNEQGAVSAVEALPDEQESLDPGFSQSAVEAVRQWRFTPATIDGTPVPFMLCVPVAFQMKL